jgi:hypothetical protein
LQKIEFLVVGGVMPFQPPRRANSHPQLGGAPPKDSPHGGLLGGGSPNQYPPRGSPLNPHVGLYGWSTLDPRMFMPLWYSLVVLKE